MLFLLLKAYFMSFIMKFLKILFNITLLVLVNCYPSSVYVKKYVYYNISDEGFLNHDTLQTIGISELRNDSDDLNLIQNKCYNRAENKAKERMVSILIHTHNSIPTKNKSETQSFLEDYPKNFSKTDLIYWSIYFQDLLVKTYIPFQKIENNRCIVVLRLEEENLLDKIQNK
jgi:hypothetical protein